MSDPLSKAIIPVPPALQVEGIARGMSYARLRQTHPQYDRDRMEELHDLHAGGYTIQKKARKYLHKLCNESDQRYDERCKTAAYRPYFGQIVEQFTSDLFGQPLSIMAAADADNPNTPGEPPDEFYTQFEGDADAQGMPFVDLMKCVITTALVQRCGYVALDAPEDSAPPAANLAEEEARGTRRLYAYEVSPRQVIDWKENRRNDTETKGVSYDWVIIAKREQERETPEDTRDKVREEYTVWRMDGGVAAWRRYAITYKVDEPPQDDTNVPLEAEGRTSFKRIPLLRLEVPKGLWVGNKIGPAAKEHWQRRSSLLSGENRSMVAIPYIGRGSELGAPGGALPSDTQQNENRGRDPVGTFNKQGFLEIGADDKIGFAEPSGTCYELVDKQLDTDKDEMFRVNHQMAASVTNRPSNLNRSGLSKAKDGEATAKVLRAMGHIIRQFAVIVYETIAAARGDDVIWTPSGLDNYEIIDRTEVIEEAVALDEIPIHSKTFKKTLKKQKAHQLVTGMDPITMAEMDKEIEDSVDDEMELTQMKQDADKAQQDASRVQSETNADNPQVPTVQVPKVPKPMLPKMGKPSPGAQA